MKLAPLNCWSFENFLLALYGISDHIWWLCIVALRWYTWVHHEYAVIGWSYSNGVDNNSMAKCELLNWNMCAGVRELCESLLLMGVIHMFVNYSAWCIFCFILCSSMWIMLFRCYLSHSSQVVSDLCYFVTLTWTVDVGSVLIEPTASSRVVGGG